MFDIDGTLVDSAGFDGDFYAQAVHEVLGVEVDRTWQSYRNVTDSGVLEEIIGQYGFDTDEVLRLEVRSRFAELVRRHVASRPIREIPGAKAMIESFRNMVGVRVAIATGGWHETALLKLRSAGIVNAGIALASSVDALERARIMQIAAERALERHAPSRRTYFGDTAWDKRASAELGFDFVAIGRGVEHRPTFDDFADRSAVLACLGVHG